MKRACISLLIPVIFLAACGGGSSTVNNPAAPPPSTGFEITPTNGLQVAGVAYGSVVSSGDMSGLVGNTGLTAGGSGGLAKPGINAKSGGVVQMVPLPPETHDCLADGTVTYTFDIVDPLILAAFMLSIGDTFLVEYVACDDGFGEILDGAIDFVVDAFSGSILSTFDTTMTMNLTDFRSTIGTDVTTSNGDATASLDTTVALVVSASVSGVSMMTNSNISSELLTNYSSAQTVDLNFDPARYTMSSSGTLDSSQLDGIVDYSTPVMFEGLGTDYPNSGELLVRGDSSSIRLVAVDNINVLIEIYSNADGTGTPDDTISTTWADLAAL